jgi:predicted P-loop ATPase
LKKLASRNNPTAAAFERLGRGGALAESGERDSKITAMCWALARELPQAHPDWIARQFESSLSLMASLAPFAAPCDVALKFRTATAKQAAEVPEVALLTSSQGGVIASIENVLRVLRGDQLLYCRWAYDEFAEKVVVNSRLPWDANGLHYPRQVNDQDFSQLAAYFMRAHRLNVSTSMALEGVWVAARESAFHPVREYILGAVPKWDGKPRIDTWLIDFCGAEDCQVNRWIGSWWLMSAVRRIADPGCKNDYCLILEGRQGRKKSQALEALASREWFTDDVPNIQDTVAAAQNIAGKWIVELAELSCVRSAKDVEAVKGFLTRQIDRYRVPYGRVSEDHPRQSVFAGSVNDSEYLTDPTGNRRFWAVRVSDKNVDVEGLREIRDQLWAEAAVRMASGEKHWPETEAQKALFERSIAKRQVSDSWSDKILCWLDNPIGYRGQALTTAFLLEQVFDIRAARRGDDARVSACLQSLGWRRDVSGTLRVWVPPKDLVSQPTNVIPLRSVS